ncbi:hypothetical protein BAE44_0016322 [Dichanthelium oligosanthes]|uniref:Uncharacterized protein n=1 Tax=Dichanthelium oligosanthes TaxID=888268 RepID=A0A1E5VBY4_9POAL|nr:hypothetical protein BAE44_0016322 [Dichanthelium oligosanthes]
MYQPSPSDSNGAAAASRTTNAAGRDVSAQISKLVNGTLFISVQIDRDPPPPAAGNHSSPLVNRYRVEIDYWDTQSRFSVRVAGNGVRQPVNATERIQTGRMPSLRWLSDPMGLFSSRGQLLHLDRWNWEVVEDDQQSSPGNYSPNWSGDQFHHSLNNAAVVLSSLFGSAAVIATSAAAVYLYLNSKYRRWKTEQEKLAKTMQSLPGVPTQVDYADIRKATKNSDLTMRLGKGGRIWGPSTDARFLLQLPRLDKPWRWPSRSLCAKLSKRRYDDFLAVGGGQHH